MGAYKFPLWSVYAGWVMRLTSCLAIPVYAIYLFFKSRGSFLQVRRRRRKTRKAAHSIIRAILQRMRFLITPQQRQPSMHSIGAAIFDEKSYAATTIIGEPATPHQTRRAATAAGAVTAAAAAAAAGGTHV